MKKVLSITGIVIILLIAAIVVLPILFKGKIINIIKEQANANLNAVVDFNDDVKLSMIKGFPKLYLEINDLIVANKSPFEGDTLANIKSLQVKLNVMEVLKGKIEIKSLQVVSPKIYIHILNDTISYTANWDITIPSDSSEGESEDISEVMSLPIKFLGISNCNLIYNDELYDMLIDLKNMNLEGKGDFSEEVFDLDAQMDAESFDFVYEGIKYLNNVHTNLDAVFGLDLITYKYTFKENVLKLNDFELKFDGFILMPESDIDMDITFEAPRTDFKNLISLIPAIYANDFNALTASGQVNFGGHLKGIYSDSLLPAFTIQLGVENGMFKYPDLPTAINNVFIDLKLDNPDGITDHTVVSLNKLHVELGKEPFDARLVMKTPESDPYVDAYIKGKVDLSQIKTLVNMDENTLLSGIVSTDLQLKGNISAIENENYDQFYAAGSVIFASLAYFSKDFNKKLEIPQLHLEFAPDFVELKQLYLLIDKSDVQANGKLTNFLPYLFDDGELQGKLNLQSTYLNLNTFLSEEDGASAAQETTQSTTIEEGQSTSSLEVYALPELIHFVMNAEIGTLIYDNIMMDHIFCKLELKDKKLTIQNLTAGLLNGTITMSGYYETSIPEEPKFDFKLAFNELNVKQTYNTFEVVRKFAPIAKYIEGGIGGDLVINSTLGNNMKPLFENLFSKGALRIKQMQIQDFAPLTLVSNTLQMDKYKNLSVKDIHPSFKIENGKFELDPVDFKIDKTVFQVKGFNSLDNSMAYDIRMDIPAEEFNAKSTALLGQFGLNNLNLKIGETIPMNVYLTGSVDKPKIKVSPLDAGKSVKEAVKETVKEEVDKQKEILEKKARDEAEKQKQIMEEKARLEAERLRLEAEQKKKEAAEKARLEAEKKKKQLEEEAKKKIKGILK
ncbi:AsmA-like C-terminal region-containing protein [Bacteroidota bacterium]